MWFQQHVFNMLQRLVHCEGTLSACGQFMWDYVRICVGFNRGQGIPNISFTQIVNFIRVHVWKLGTVTGSRFPIESAWTFSLRIWYTCIAPLFSIIMREHRTPLYNMHRTGSKITDHIISEKLRKGQRSCIMIVFFLLNNASLIFFLPTLIFCKMSREDCAFTSD